MNIDKSLDLLIKATETNKEENAIIQNNNIEKTE